MITKHCLRFAFNLCPKQAKGNIKSWRATPMQLIHGDEVLTLKFDCRPCEMHVVGKIKNHILKMPLSGSVVASISPDELLKTLPKTAKKKGGSATLFSLNAGLPALAVSYRHALAVSLVYVSAAAVFSLLCGVADRGSSPVAAVRGRRQTPLKRSSPPEWRTPVQSFHTTSFLTLY